MTDGPASVTLHVEPSAIPLLYKAYDQAVATLSNHTTRLEHEGFLKEPWLGDEMSLEVRNFYNERIMAALDGPFASLLAYKAELTKIRDTLKRMEEEYRRTEGDNVELWGRL